MLGKLVESKLSILNSILCVLDTYTVSFTHKVIKEGDNVKVVNTSNTLIMEIDDDLVLSHLENIKLSVPQRIALERLFSALQFIVSDIYKEKERILKNKDDWGELL